MQKAHPPEQRAADVDHDRRVLMLLALVGASSTALGKATDRMTMAAPAHQVPGHLVTRNLGAKPSRIPGYARITQASLTFQPGDRINFTMANPALCQMAEGRLEARRAGESFVANTGDFWTCNTGDRCEAVNRGPGVAVMRYFNLLPK